MIDVYEEKKFDEIKEIVCGWLRRLWLTKKDAKLVSNLIKTVEDGERFIKLLDKLEWKSIDEYYEEYETGNYGNIKYLLDVCNRLRLLKEYNIDSDVVGE